MNNTVALMPIKVRATRAGESVIAAAPATAAIREWSWMSIRQ